ncbi:MAG: TonB-dependent receptor [Prevotella sp.]|jgi:TonB-linked SusC/RagA family outer membrane protein|nr:TonB-dependent receptor [Prevotella sp.]MCH3970338.1 TonB-dependent receptor [Prevotella sp.]MCH4099978.1 TonB-dependent receptor [Prevotella sp.]MCI1475126.1 TonB-dependent receptor [Prevotella sp.]MCI1548705.1 TonB-dependent receptor [Prevotella sp.]MCI1596641.1 TonB-dependent receptor [Prevotella sp.]
MNSKIPKFYVLLLLVTMCNLSGFAQTNIVKGIVKDVNNEPIIGASVVEKGNPSNGTVTDLDGKFKLQLKKGIIATISYVGMISQEIKASTLDQNIILKEESGNLDEIVVLGYTSRARKDLTGSVGSISGAKLTEVPVASAAEALQGKIAGVQVTSVDGAPGSDINIRVRGSSSVTQSNEPLYIVDGFQTDNINNIPPSDIASIDVLKDASLTAIYGAKGGNGVVVVTTKSAKEGKISVSFNGRLSTAHLSKKLDLMNATQFVDYQYDRAAANGTRSSWAKQFRGNFGNPLDIDIYQRAHSYNWQDEVMGETPLNYMGNVTVGGGSEKIQFNTSLTQSNDDGIIMGSGVRRTNLNIKINVNLSKRLTLTLNPWFTFRRDIGAGGSNIGSGGIIDVLKYRPTNGLRDFAFWDPRTVDPDEEAIFQYTNPKNDIKTNVQKKHGYNYINQFSLNWNIFKGLNLRTEFSHNLLFSDLYRYYGPLTSVGQDNNSLPVAEITNYHKEAYTWTNTAIYDMSLNDMHNFEFLLGQEIYNNQYKQQFQENRYFPRSVEAQRAFDNMELGTPWQSTSFRSTPNRTASFFGQVSYNFNHKYLAAFTIRADGSTKFAPNHQWGYFPSISGAWVLSKEKFMKNIKWIDNMKIRASLGTSGNNNISDDLWRYLYTVSTTGGPGFGESTPNGEQYYSFGSGSQLVNPKVKWETTIKRNLAADISLFDGRLQITPEFYWNTTKDLLYQSDIPSTTGYTTQMQNIGQVSNHGIDITLNGDVLRGSDYILSANFTLGYNKMKIDKLNNTDNILWAQASNWKSSYNDYCLKVGNEVGLIYGFVYDGLYRPDEFTFDPNQDFLAVPKAGTVINTVSNSTNSGEATLPGKIKFKDLDGDGKITENDRKVLGHTTPRVQGGFGLSGQWKDFDFNCDFTYMLDYDLYNATAYALSSATNSSSSFTNVLSKFSTHRWRYTDPNTGECLYKNYYIDGSVDMYKALNAKATLWNPADVTNNLINSYFVENASFLRCSDITIGYTLPNRWINKLGLTKLRIYVSGSNLFVITNYSGFDPEVNLEQGLTSGMDYNCYPRNRQFSFGVNLTF